MIKKINIYETLLHFKKTFQITYEKVDTARVIIIKIIDSEGRIGLGSAAPDEEVTGETIEKVLKILQRKLTKKFFSEDISKWYFYHEKIKETFSGFSSAQSAVEEAVLNLWSRITQIPLKKIWGNYRDSCPTIITIGIQNNEETIKEIRQRLREGFKMIKLKCGLNLKEDLLRIKTAAKIIPSDSRLALDANQGYSLEEAKKLLEEIKKLKITFLEQPVNKKNWSGLKKLHLLNSTPILADESAVTLNDAYKLLNDNYVSGINVKLMKCGGPINFLKIFHLAKSLNKIVMVGCMYESNISLTTAAELALALPLDYVELDSGYLDFKDDPAQGGMEVKNGKIRLLRPLSVS